MENWTVLYKYRSMEPAVVDFTRSIVVDSQLYFAAPSSFNDPFDTLPAVSVKSTPAERETYYRELIDLHRTDASDEEKAAFLHHMTSLSESQRLEVARGAFSDTTTTMAVCCLSTKPDSVLMWSHYAANHTGICLRFFAPRNWAQPVVYSEQRPVLNRIRTAISAGIGREPDLEAWGQAVLTKADFWRYEDEWRVLGLDGPGAKPFPAKSLCGIIFGARATAETRATVADWIEQRGIPLDLLDAVPDRNTFRLNIVPQPGARYSL